MQVFGHQPPLNQLFTCVGGIIFVHSKILNKPNKTLKILCIFLVKDLTWREDPKYVRVSLILENKPNKTPKILCMFLVKITLGE